MVWERPWEERKRWGKKKNEKDSGLCISIGIRVRRVREKGKKISSHSFYLVE